MDHTKKKTGHSIKECDEVFAIENKYRQQLKELVDMVVKPDPETSKLENFNIAAIPSRESVIEILGMLEKILYIGYFAPLEIDRSFVPFYVGDRIYAIFERLSYQISKSLEHECRRMRCVCVRCIENGQEEAITFLRKIPQLRRLLAGDLQAAYDGDPAAKSLDEIIFSYPCIKAVTTYRIAHELHVREVPLIPRIMTEHAHSITGIDIHPGARIGRNFFIDHGTGVVVGETCEIGENVKLYQGVTLGALSFPKDERGKLIRGHKRHPTIEDNVTIYAGATILGGETVIGAGSVIGGNVWLTSSVPPGTKVATETQERR